MRGKRRVRWTRLDAPGKERAALLPGKGAWRLQGRVRTILEESTASIDYEISCRGDWTFVLADVAFRWHGTRRDLTIVRDAGNDWSVSRMPRPDLAACVDVDLSVTPSTNTIPIRRLSLAIGERAEVTAAWVRFPQLVVEPLPQRYTRLARNLYRYESLRSGFVADLETDGDGLVVTYPHLWARS